MKYRQCLLRKQQTSGYSEQVSYLPEKFAKKGATLRLKNSDGAWDEGWIVQSIGPLEDEDRVKAQSRVYLELSSIQEPMGKKKK